MVGKCLVNSCWNSLIFIKIIFHPYHLNLLSRGHNREFQQGFTTDLPTIYQWFTKDLPKIRKYLAFYFLNTYQGFTKDLPMIYQRLTKDLPSLPNTYQQLTKIFFNLPQIYQQFTKNVWTKIFWYFYMYFLKNI